MRDQSVGFVAFERDLKHEKFDENFAEFIILLIIFPYVRNVLHFTELDH